MFKSTNSRTLRLTQHYNVTPAAMGFAINASIMGMAFAALVIGFLSPHIDRRYGARGRT